MPNFSDVSLFCYFDALVTPFLDNSRDNMYPPLHNIHKNFVQVIRVCEADCTNNMDQVFLAKTVFEELSK